MPYENSKYTIYLHRLLGGGKSQLVPCTMEILAPEHVEQSVALHDRVARGLSGDIYLPSDREDIVRYLTDDGITIGVWFEDRLICARTVKTGAAWVEKSLAAIEEPLDPTHKTAVTGYTIVDREFRGNNVQFLSYFLSENLLAQDFDTILTTVAPKNIFSLQNVMHCGFYITDLRDLYGSYLRYILRKKLKTGVPIWTSWHHAIPIRNVEAQQGALSEGKVGYKIVHKMRGLFILYGHLGDAPPEDRRHFHPRPPIRLL
ncbi:hypothetical protein LJC40_01485 [Synergistaceae bacterium OttesenSCG-928-D05]|nr:hypothetical protein [Synergistaceae bacterium OttesenSCG-928-D05]